MLRAPAGKRLSQVQSKQRLQKGRQVGRTSWAIGEQNECRANHSLTSQNGRTPRNDLRERAGEFAVSQGNQSGTGELHGEAFNELRERDAAATR